jgi:pyridoxal phosphate enzyme (YggS family)
LDIVLFVQLNQLNIMFFDEKFELIWTKVDHMQAYSQQYAALREKIQRNCQDHARAVDSVELLAVSKTHPIQAIEAFYQLGQRAFAENYLQEALAKIHALAALDISWHFIGHVQRNKTKALAEHFAWVHGVDRLLIAERLSQQRPAALPALNLCIQVNIDAQDSKDGCQIEEVAGLVEQISRLPQIQLRGLMVIPQAGHHAAFAQCQQLFEQVKPLHAQPEHWDTLSMGMSADMEQAIAAGATMLRIGTALFGQRDYSAQN